MSEDRDYGFCPRCGALMHDGVCRSCGYARHSIAQQARGGAEDGQVFQRKEPYGQPYGQGAYTQPRREKKNRKVLIIVLCIICALILVIGLILSFSFLGKAVGRISQSTDIYYDDGYDGYYDDGYDDFGDYGSGYYEPSSDDPYYKEITDCTRTDLEYGISWIVESITPDDDEDYCTYYSTYPLLDGKEGAYASINKLIEQKALEYRDTYTSYPGGCATYGYVTYMDEEMISIAFQHDIYQEDGTLPRLSAVTFDLESGQEILPEQMTDLDGEFVMRFRAQNETQNGNVEFVENSSDEELLALLRDPDMGVFFYSPVGLEAGFNYESEGYSSGWVTVTLKDQTL